MSVQTDYTNFVSNVPDYCEEALKNAKEQARNFVTEISEVDVRTNDLAIDAINKNLKTLKNLKFDSLSKKKFQIFVKGLREINKKINAQMFKYINPFTKEISGKRKDFFNLLNEASRALVEFDKSIVEYELMCNSYQGKAISLALKKLENEKLTELLLENWNQSAFLTGNYYLRKSSKKDTPQYTMYTLVFRESELTQKLLIARDFKEKTWVIFKDDKPQNTYEILDDLIKDVFLKMEIKDNPMPAKAPSTDIEIKEYANNVLASTEQQLKALKKKK